MVLPAIRKDGGYMAPAVAKLAVESPAEFMPRALVMVNESIQGLPGGPRRDRVAATIAEAIGRNGLLSNRHPKFKMSFVAPSLTVKSFTCPHCGVLARHHKWGYELAHASPNLYRENSIGNAALQVSLCESCGENCLWVRDNYVFPEVSQAPRPNADMPDDVKVDYIEAATIYNKSPRGAAALLRLAIQKLTVHLGQPGKNINDDIAALVASGLPVQVQQALDVVRVTGNNAVHPGTLDVNDVDVAAQLFPLLNVIVEYRISLPNRINEMYNALPEGARTAIQKRDQGGSVS